MIVIIDCYQGFKKMFKCVSSKPGEVVGSVQVFFRNVSKKDIEFTELIIIYIFGSVILK